MKIKGFQDTIAWYNSNAKQYATELKGRERKTTLKRFHELINKKAKVLDVGCAAGRDSVCLAEYGYDVTGVDLASGLINIAKVEYPQIKFFEANFLNLPFKDDSFDGVWSHASLLHLETTDDVKKALKEFHRVMKKGGILMVYVKAQSSYGKKTAIVTDNLSHHDRFFQFFTQEELAGYLKDAGFEILEMSQQNETEIKELKNPRSEVDWILIFSKKI